MVRALIFVVFAAIVLATGSAVAGDDTVVDVGPVLETLLGSLAAAVMAIGSWALARLAKRLGLEADSKIRAYLDEALYRAIGYATSRLRDEGTPILIDVKSELVARATNYILDRVPDAVSHFGLDSRSIGRLIEARLPALPSDPPAGS